MLCCLFSGLTLLVLNSNACRDNDLVKILEEQTPNLNLSFESSCVLGSGAKSTIAATVLWFVAAIAALKADPPTRSPLTQTTHDVTYTRTTGVDGATVVQENVIVGEPVPVGEGGLTEPLVPSGGEP